jgi:hypothetical protein
MRQGAPAGSDGGKPRRGGGWFVVAALTAALLAQGVMVARNPVVDEMQEHSPGDTLPDVPLVTADGADTSLDLVLAGAPCHLIVFYNKDCRFCEIRAPLWRGIEEVNGLPVLWISVPAPRRDALAFLVRHGISAPALILPDVNTSHRVGVFGTPLSMIVDRQRMILSYTATDPEKVPPVESCTSYL